MNRTWASYVHDDHFFPSCGPVSNFMLSQGLQQDSFQEQDATSYKSQPEIDVMVAIPLRTVKELWMVGPSSQGYTKLHHLSKFGIWETAERIDRLLKSIKLLNLQHCLMTNLVNRCKRSLCAPVLKISRVLEMKTKVKELHIQDVVVNQNRRCQPPKASNMYTHRIGLTGARVLLQLTTRVSATYQSSITMRSRKISRESGAR